MPEEPEIIAKPKVDPGGKITPGSGDDKPKETPAGFIPEDQYNKVVDIARSVYQYVKENADGTREFDVPRMVDDLGYDPTVLRKKGEKSKEPEPKPEELEKVKKDMKDEFNKDPEAFLKRHSEKILEEAKKQIETSTKPLTEKLRAREIEEMVTTVANEFDDFESLQEDIAKLARGKPPRNSDDLRDLYYAAKGRKQQSSGTGLAGSNRGSAKAGKNTPKMTPEEAILDGIMGYAAHKESPEGKALSTLIGKSTLSPLRDKQTQRE